jgi:predicted S18 family serine protease
MKKYAIITNEQTKSVAVGEKGSIEFFKSIGMVEMEVEQAWDGSWYLTGYAPEKPAPTKEEVSETRRQLYTQQVDPITAHINRLKDEEQTDEVIAQIEALKSERAEVVAKIKSENKYPEEI